MRDMLARNLSRFISVNGPLGHLLLGDSTMFFWRPALSVETQRLYQTVSTPVKKRRMSCASNSDSAFGDLCTLQEC